MAAEGILGWWALSRNQNATASDQQTAGESLSQDEATKSSTKAERSDEELPVTEVELGSFQLSNRTSSGLNMHVQLGLSGTVPESLSEEFAELSEQHRSRIRQSVLSIIRSSTQEDLADPALSLVRRKIEDQLNRLLDKKYLVDVVVTEVSIFGE